MGWLLVSGIVEEGADRRQSEIAAAGRDASTFFQVVQERRNQWCIDLCESELGRLLVESLLGKTQQQAKGVPIGTDGVRTRLPLTHETLGKEALQ